MGFRIQSNISQFTQKLTFQAMAIDLIYIIILIILVNFPGKFSFACSKGQFWQKIMQTYDLLSQDFFEII